MSSKEAVVGHQAHEHIEHAGHEAGQGGLARWIGITVAILGVLLALCSAQLGAARTELISTMVEENSAKSQYTAVANKYRMLQAQLQHLHAAMPDPEFIAKKDRELNALLADVKSPDNQQGIRASQLQTEKLLNTVIPTPDDVARFLALLDRTREQTEAAKHWSESYREAVDAHKHTAEHFEYALISVEIGIVIASVGLLLAKQQRMARAAWGTAVVLGVLSLGIAGASFVANKRTLHTAEEKIHADEHHYASMNKEDEEVAQDKKLEEDIRKGLPVLKKLMAGNEPAAAK
jgi:hypothetical protein